ncbi:hypothetical protein Lal_00048433 [Lupinus albus]|uniref:Putative transcription factor C3H family n=1 Tax=Lupinus albus TaxID=3870 RepID=A0A6A5MEM1_LUPAL|nr:putative transcription factor C3H family [Lupinus albus]KAF1869152.1 hypothetical protein Lal_00048433 [Lupinus albus]
MNPLTLVKRIQNINSKEAALGIGEEASWHSKYKDSAYIFVGGIPFDLTEGDLIAVFAQYGEVVDVNLVRDKGTGKSKGFAFIAYEDQRSTTLAVDNLNGAQILGRIVRVDHVDKYKKKEEEDEETERQKREARGVCRAFQRGECTRGAGCKFSHDEQRAANTGWGQEDNSSKWGNDKFDGPKKEIRSVNNQSNRVPETRDRDSRSRAHHNERGLDSHRREEMLRRHDDNDIFEGRENNTRREEKKSRRHGEDDEFERRSREDRHRREENRSRRNDYDDMEPDPRDHHRREDRSSRKADDVEFEPKSRDSDTREDERPRRQDDDDDFGHRSREAHVNREERRSRKHNEDYDRKQDSRSYKTYESESKVRYDDAREEKRSRR